MKRTSSLGLRAFPAPFLALAAAAVLSGCDAKPQPAPTPSAAAGAAPTNRVDINPAVRQNLGIIFAAVESRRIEQTLRVPGRFELLPTAEREHRAPAAGSVELLVRQYDRVEAGAPLYRLDSPRWRELQRELTEADAAVRLAEAVAASIGPFTVAHERHHVEIQRAVDLWTERVEALESLQASGAVRAEDLAQARAALATARAEFAETLEKEAELAARASESAARLDAARSQFSILLEAASSLAGLPREELLNADGEQPRWRTISQIEVRAHSPGVVNAMHATSGAFVDQHAPVITTVQPELVRFRAHGLQSDVGRLSDGLAAVVVPPLGGSLAGAEPVAGAIRLAPLADAQRRTVELIMTPSPDAPPPEWARAGIAAFLEITLAGAGAEQLAIPLACVARDGAHSIIFRRDPRNPDAAIRMQADLGASDGRWVAIRSGVAEGDEIVLDGVYQLMVATSGSITKGGHFHPDGTFHEGED